MENSQCKKVKLLSFFKNNSEEFLAITHVYMPNIIIIDLITLASNAGPAEIHESFVGFSEVSGGTASELASDILSVVESKGLQMSNCRGQGYDGGANMSGIHSGVQARISAIELTAKYVHCAAHNTNLVLNDSMSKKHSGS